MQTKSLNMENETFIKTYENAIPHVLCDMLIEKFDANTDQWENRDKRTEDRGNLKFNEVHLFKYMDTWKEEVEALADLFKIYVDDYKNQYSEFMFPPKYGIEPFKMKKYEANGLDEFGWHVDVNSTGSMNRWLAFFCYLSDNDEGHTSFPYQKVGTDCKKGTIVMFPPMWPWLHQGTKPVVKPKYFLGSYLHYVD